MPGSASTWSNRARRRGASGRCWPGVASSPGKADLEEARRIGLEAVEREESVGDAWEAAIFRSMLGFIELSVPHPGAALEHLRIALDQPAC